MAVVFSSFNSPSPIVNKLLPLSFLQSGKVVEDEQISYDDTKDDSVDCMMKEKLRKSYLNKINDILT